MPARLDRLVSVCLHRASPWSNRGPAAKHVPILMYHSISEERESHVHPYYRLATRPARFAEQMQWLADSGWTGVSLEEAFRLLATGRTHGRGVAAITFDDGFRDFYTGAWPVLKHYGFSATMYLPTAFIGAPRKSFRDKECLDWNEVRELRAGGIQFGSHTVNHVKLYPLSRPAISEELRASKERLEQELGEGVDSFAYPYAFPQEDGWFTREFSELLRCQGYRNCVTTVVGCARLWDDPFCLKRLPVNSEDDRSLFVSKLSGAYDWLGTFQRAYRQARSWQRLAFGDNSARATMHHPA
jgi:peptidoglycan/xylan/chitin deacetylase (PgdA/CDA1 family)